MNRRRLLKLSAATASMGLFAGCGGGSDGGGGGSDGDGDGGSDGADGGGDGSGSSEGGAGGSGICGSADFALTRAEAVDDATVGIGVRNQIEETIQPVSVEVKLNNAETYEAEISDPPTVESGGEFSVMAEIDAGPDSIFSLSLFYRDEEGECSLGSDCPHEESICLTGVL